MIQKKKASDSIISDIVLQLSFLLDSGKIYRNVGRADCGNDFFKQAPVPLLLKAYHQDIYGKSIKKGRLNYAADYIKNRRNDVWNV